MYEQAVSSHPSAKMWEIYWRRLIDEHESKAEEGDAAAAVDDTWQRAADAALAYEEHRIALGLDLDVVDGARGGESRRRPKKPKGIQTPSRRAGQIGRAHV